MKCYKIINMYLKNKYKFKILAIIFLMLSSSGFFAQSKSMVKSVNSSDIKVGGELLLRIQKNFDRLEETKYQPKHVFLNDKQSGNWPGDTEGRTILALVMNAQSSKRDPKYLEEIINLIPAHLNRKGYMGKIYPLGIMDEQQLSGNGWMIRGLCEYYEWKRDPKVLKIVKSIVDSLFLPGKGLYKEYPIEPSTRNQKIGEAMGTIYKTIGKWNLSTDIGCVFIGMDGLIKAYQYFPTEEVKIVIDEMISRFLEMDLIAIKAQTHASLTAMRGLLTYAAYTNNQKLIREVEKRWIMYLQYGMMEDYANYNWFRRYDAPSEPCAIVDSYIVAMKLWELTQKPEYLPYLDLIYYNALSHSQRNNGGFGCDIFDKPDSCHLSVRIPEAHWCCTMRGADGLAHVAKTIYYTNANSLYLLHFVDNESNIHFSKNKSLRVLQNSTYPFGNKIELKLLDLQNTSDIDIRLKLPAEWIKSLKIHVNKKVVKYQIENGFVVLKQKWNNNDHIDIFAEPKLFVVNAINNEKYSGSLKKVMLGPVLLGSKTTVQSAIPKNLKFKRTDGGKIKLRNSDIELEPVYHLMEQYVIKGDSYFKQILFK